MSIFKRARASLPALLGLLVFSFCRPISAADELGTTERTFHPKIFPASDEGLKAMKTFRPAAGLKLDLFAAEPLLANPVAFCFDEQGRVYVSETFRLHAGVGDIRGRVGWEDPAVTRKLGSEVVADYMLNEELASKSVEEDIAFLKRHFGPRAASLAGESERIQLITPGADGKAERSQVFAEGFDRIGDGIAAGILARKGTVWFTSIPDVWMLKDSKGTGSADMRKVLHHGYGVRVGFLGHDLHGLRIGPDGKLYFSVGDRGGNVRGWDGKHVVNLEYGAVYRCNQDGSGLEIFALGLRNPQELAFDQYGNLFTGDNNSDGGDPARWVYVVEAGDSGWRVGYQFQERPKDADLLTQRLQARGAWLNERQCYPQFDGQAAFLVPPIDIIGNGPSGLTYYPGVGFPEKYQNHFFLCDFKGSSPNSLIHSIAMKPKGAGFEVVDREPLISNVLPTDVEFGPDCRLYFSDWVNGWEMPGKGRLYRVFDEQLAQSPQVLETKKIIGLGMEHRSENELLKLLAHPDQRIRQEAQFALADKNAIKALARVARKNDFQLARIHALWALGQIGETNQTKNGRNKALESILPLLADSDAEVTAQAAKILGNARFAEALSGLTRLAGDTANPRGQFFAALGLGKIGRKESVPAVLQMLRENGDRDAFLRHAGVMALVWIHDLDAILEAGRQDSPAVRMASLLALRRMQQQEVAMFLKDSDPKIVVEAARAINDASLYSAQPELAGLISQMPRLAATFKSRDAGSPETDLLTPLLRRVINANYRIGDSQNAVALAEFAGNATAPEFARFETLQQLGRWEKPSARDQITGLYRPLPSRDARVAADALRPMIAEIARNGPTSVRVVAIKTAAELGITGIAAVLFENVQNKNAPSRVRVESLKALAEFNDEKLAEAIKIGDADENVALRMEATRQHARLKPVGATDKLVAILENGTVAEKQNALTTLGTVEGAEADKILAGWLDQLTAGKVAPELQLDLLDAAGKRSAPEVKTKLALYESGLPKDDDLARFRATLAGGNADEGKKIFFERPEASCVRCHKIGTEGGEVGPVLSDIGKRQTREYILESVVQPNKKIAAGFETLIVTLKSGLAYAGILKGETDAELTLLSPEDGLIKIKKADIEKRERGLSGMPEGMAEVLSRKDIRNLVEFLASQKQLP